MENRLGSRDAAIAALREADAVDVLIIGAGINGIGLYRDLAAQGVQALLVDQADFCSGTSAAPSRLVHGGVRYLETGEFDLVRESVVERNRLLRNAPHLVKPLAVWVPLRHWWAGLLKAPARFLGWTRAPGAKGAIVTKLGLMLYDRFGRDAPATPRHRLIPRAEVRQRVPSMDPAVKTIAEFYDARLIHPERLALELIKDAEADSPRSLAIPYLSVQACHAGRVALRDELGHETLHVRPRVVVNAAGPWVDRVNGRLQLDTRLIGGTRGSHVVLRHEQLARELADRMIYFETADHRICLAYGIGDDRVLLGTTDIRVADPDDKQCTAEEIRYLFAELHAILPQIHVSERHIVFQYAGIRPLPNSNAAVAGAVSRDHSLHRYAPTAARPFPVLALVGGKWTTYRSCSEQMADDVLRMLERPRLNTTADSPIGGGRDWPAGASKLATHLDALSARFGLPLTTCQALWNRYGSACTDALRAVAATGSRQLDATPGYWLGELLCLIRGERVTRLEDLVLRRTLLAFEGRCTLATLVELGGLMAGELGWDARRQHDEIADTAALLRKRHGVMIEPQAATEAADAQFLT